MSRTRAMVAAVCAALSAALMVLSCGLAAMIRQYREFTVPLVLLSGLAFVVLGVIAFRGFMAREPGQQPPA